MPLPIGQEHEKRKERESNPQGSPPLKGSILMPIDERAVFSAHARAQWVGRHRILVSWFSAKR